MTQEFAYTIDGNLTMAWAIGYYAYPAPGSPRPHAVTSISHTHTTNPNEMLTYNANGNLVSGRGRAYTWDGENRPVEIANANNGKTAQFIYGPRHAACWRAWRSFNRPIPGSSRDRMASGSGSAPTRGRAGRSRRPITSARNWSWRLIRSPGR